MQRFTKKKKEKKRERERKKKKSSPPDLPISGVSSPATRFRVATADYYSSSLFFFFFFYITDNDKIAVLCGAQDTAGKSKKFPGWISISVSRDGTRPVIAASTRSIRILLKCQK